MRLKLVLASKVNRNEIFINADIQGVQFLYGVETTEKTARKTSKRPQRPPRL